MPTQQQNLAFAIRAVNEANSALTEVRNQIQDVEMASALADKGLSNFDETMGDVFAAADAGAGSMAGFGAAIGGIAEAGGNAERALMGVKDITGFLNEQFGISLGPVEKYANSFAQLGGGIEAALQGGPALLAQLKGIVVGIGPAIASTWAYVTALWAQAAAFIAANAPIILLVAGLALLGVGIVLLVKYWDDIVAKVPALGTAVDGVKAAFDATATFITGTVVPALQVLWGYITDPILPILKTAVELYLLPLKLAFEAASWAVTNVVIPGLSALWGFFSDTLLPVLRTAIDVYLYPLKVAFEAAKDGAGFLKTGAEALANFFTDTVMPKIEALAKVAKDTLRPALDIAATGIDLFKRGFEGLRDLIQGIIDKIQSLIDKINSIPTPSLPSLPSSGGGVPFVPGIADGGVVTRPTFALIGEGGEPEAVVPLSKAGSFGFGGGGGLPVVINAIDARSFRDWLDSGGASEIAAALARR